MKSLATDMHVERVEPNSLSWIHGCNFQCKLGGCLASEKPMNIFCLACVHQSLGEFGHNGKQTLRAPLGRCPDWGCHPSCSQVPRGF